MTNNIPIKEVMKKTVSVLFFFMSFSLVFVSCGGGENDDDQIYSNQVSLISLLPDKYNVVLKDNPEEQDFITLKVTNNAGLDITGSSVFLINGNVEIESNVFIPTELGTFQVRAKYTDPGSGKEFLSDPKSINVIDQLSAEDMYFKHKVLVEDFTGTWCGWCTRIIYALELIEAQTHNVIPVAIHNNDEFDFTGRTPLEDYLMIEGAYPFAAINRKTIWKNPQHHNVSQPIELIQPESPVGIKINSNLENSSGTVDLSFYFKENISGQLKYAVYVVENQLKADQKNYNSDLYEGVPVLYNFTHNHTLRGVYGNIIGNNLEQEATERTEIVLSDLAVNYSCENISNLQIVVFLMNEEGSVLNVQIADGNTEKDYEFAN